jgi:hypothetical protein
LTKARNDVIIYMDKDSKKLRRTMNKTVSVLAFFCVAWCLAPAAMAQIAGDASGDGVVDVGDLIYEINYLFLGGQPPEFYECGDPNTDCKIDIADVVYLLNYLFLGGSDPEMVYCEWSEPVNLGEPINSPQGEESFRMTPDGRMAVWASNRYGTHGNHDIWYSFWDSLSGSWSEPVNCGTNVNTMIEDLGPCLSPDGQKLYYQQFGRPGGYGGWEIWVSTWDSVNGEWGVPENLGPTINATGSEWSPFVSPDGSQLYFSRYCSIWVCEWNGSGWGTPVRLDTTVNSTFSEQHASVTGDNSTLYFTRYYSSTYSIWVSHWNGTGWGTAEILPPQINDPIGAGWSYITVDGMKHYFVSARPGGVGSGDIWVSVRIPVRKSKYPNERR